MAPIDIIILAIVIVALVASLLYAFKRGGGCGDCPSHGVCTASIDGHCPVSEATITRIERGLHDMTGTLGGESCGMMTTKQSDERADKMPDNHMTQREEISSDDD